MCPSDALGLTHHSGPWLQPQAASVADQLLWPMRFYCLRPASSVPRGSGFSCHLRTHQRRMKSTAQGMRSDLYPTGKKLDKAMDCRGKFTAREVDMDQGEAGGWRKPGR